MYKNSFVGALVVAASVMVPALAGAQSGWPTAKTAAPVAEVARAEAAPVPAAKPAPAPAPAPVATPKAEPVAAAPVAAPKAEADVPAVETPVAAVPVSLIESLTALLARQGAALEALMGRFEAAPVSAPAASALPADPADPTPAPPVATVVAAEPPVAPPLASLAGPAPLPAQIPVLRPAAPRRSLANGLDRWIAVDKAKVAFRYRRRENSDGEITHNQAQDHFSFDARLKFDPAGRYAVNAGLASGASIESAWNNNGWGSGGRANDLHLKTLYLSAAPVSGLEFQYGGLGVERGENSEITTYDNDVYMTGQRVTVKRGDALWFDQVTATQAYLGDTKLPDVWDRYQRLSEPNYYQVLLGKKIGSHVGVSGEYAEVEGVGTWRTGVGVKAPMVALDGFRFEAYARPETAMTAFGWALMMDKKAGPTAFTGGYASIDPNYGGLNADFFNEGNRWYGKVKATLFPAFTVETKYVYTLETDYFVKTRKRFDLVFTYDVLKAVKAATAR